MSRRCNGEGTIFKRTIKGQVYYVSRYKVGKTKDGKDDFITKYSKTQAEAKEKLENIITEKNTNKLLRKSEITLEDIIEKYIDDLYRVNKLKDVSYTRKIEYFNIIKKHYISKLRVQEIKDYDVNDFFEYITSYSNSVIQHIYGLLNNSFKLAIKYKVINYNILDDKIYFSRPISKKETKKVRGFTIQEQQDFLKYIKDPNCKCLHKYQMLISLFTGMRMGEINALYVSDIDFDNNVIHIRRTLTKDKNDKTTMGNTTKTYSGNRDIVIDNQLKSILKEFMNSELYVKNKYNLLFYNLKNVYFSTGQINMEFKRFCQKWNIADGYNVNQHQLRHTFATRCIEAGVPPVVLSKILGHKDIETTLNVYSDVFDLYEKQNNEKVSSYLRKNNIMFIEDVDFKNRKELDRILEIFKKMYENNDSKLLEILKLLPKKY